MSSEWIRIELLRAALGGTVGSHVLLGIGDDAAVLAPGTAPLVWTVDASVENVHFRRGLLSLSDIGFRATMAAASDLAAMGAAPLGLLAALVLPAWVGDQELAALAAGQREAADALGTSVIGGNLARGGELSLTTTALGTAARPLTRAGAKPGDGIWIAGAVGMAAAGLLLLERGEGARSDAAANAWKRPRARIEAGRVAASKARAAIDVSDGLAQDVGHVAKASGTTAILDAAALVGDELRRAASAVGRDAEELALHGGEDYALVVVMPGTDPLDGFMRIGEMAALEHDTQVALRREDGSLVVLDHRGFDHFREPLNGTPRASVHPPSPTEPA